MNALMKRTILLWSEGGWFERVVVEARALRAPERVPENEARFKDDRLVADITWQAGLLTNNQSSRLQPMNAIELRAFGVACIELAGEMERAERKT